MVVKSVMRLAGLMAELWAVQTVELMAEKLAVWMVEQWGKKMVEL